MHSNLTWDWLFDVQAGDGDNDGDNEVYATTYSGGIYQYKWINDSWQRTLVYDEGHELTRVAVGDGDNNGTTEIYVADYGDPGPPLYWRTCVYV